MKLSPQNYLVVSLFAHFLVFDSLNFQKIQHERQLRYDVIYRLVRLTIFVLEKQ